MGFHAGQRIGRYTLIRVIGRGGFGEVWLAENRAEFSTTEFALKLLLDGRVDFEAVKQEADVWVRAGKHHNVLRLLEADRFDGQIVFVSEYMPDGSLENLLEREGKLAPTKAAEIMMGVLAGLDFLHSIPIIHRDVKPANVLMEGETPRVGDFGISRALNPTDLSRSMIVAGTPPYMAPEAFDRKRNAQIDIWSAGVTLYQILSGNLPFPQQDLGSLIEAIRTREPDPLPDSIPRQLRSIVRRALAKDPAQRYSTAQEMRAELRQFIVEPVSTIIPILPDGLNTKRKRILAALALLLAAGLLVAIYLIGSRASKQPDRESTRQTANATTSPSTTSSTLPTPESSSTPVTPAGASPAPTEVSTIPSESANQRGQQSTNRLPPAANQLPTKTGSNGPLSQNGTADRQTTPGKGEAEFNRLLSQARTLLDNNQPAPAYHRYEQALASLPDRFKTRVGWDAITEARLSYGREEYPKAATQFERAFRNFPRRRNM